MLAKDRPQYVGMAAEAGDVRRDVVAAAVWLELRMRVAVGGRGAGVEAVRAAIEELLRASKQGEGGGQV
jgi:hypothetical protein